MLQTTQIRRIINEYENNRSDLIQNHQDLLDQILDSLVSVSEKLSLSEFIEVFLYPYDAEAKYKNWKVGGLLDLYYSTWESNIGSCILAPRDHLKTYSALAYIIKKVFERKYPLEINYYHLSSDIAGEKFQKMQRIIERNPILNESFLLKPPKFWSSDLIELSDGTVIRPMSYEMGVVGKHPHIIVLDDVIDRRVIYSDQRNQKAIDKFYMDIYPQITDRIDTQKKLIIIGTAQRSDDLYHKLPNDYPMSVYEAVNEDTKTVLFPEKFTYEQLMQIKTDMTEKHGIKYWLKEFMNKPMSAIGLIIKEDWLRFYGEDILNRIVEVKRDTRVRFRDKLEIYQGWDLSVGKDLEKGDWTVGTTIGIDKYTDTNKIYIYILDIFRARIDFDARLNAIQKYAQEFEPLGIGVEEVAFQYDTVKALKNRTLLPITGIKSVKNKIESFQVELAPYFENGQVYIHEKLKGLYTQELLSLPAGEYDDQADATKFAIKMALSRPRLKTSSAGIY